LLVELAAGLVFLGLYLGFGLNPGLVVLACVAVALLVLGAAHLVRRR
jgi:hypothetical protein